MINESYDTAVSEGSTAAAQAWRQLPHAMRNTLGLTGVVLGVLSQMRIQRPDWFDGLGKSGQRQLSTDIISATRERLNGGPL
jgi:hypothetical protein